MRPLESNPAGYNVVMLELERLCVCVLTDFDVAHLGCVRDNEYIYLSLIAYNNNDNNNVPVPRSLHLLITFQILQSG